MLIYIYFALLLYVIYLGFFRTCARKFFSDLCAQVFFRPARAGFFKIINNNLLIYIYFALFYILLYVIYLGIFRTCARRFLSDLRAQVFFWPTSFQPVVHIYNSKYIPAFIPDTLGSIAYNRVVWLVQFMFYTIYHHPFWISNHRTIRVNGNRDGL